MTGQGKETGGAPQEGGLSLNIAMVLFLIAVLIAAWFILDRLIGG